MRLPSMQNIAHDAAETFARFPLPLLSAMIGTASAVILLDHEGPAQPTVFWSMLFGGILGISILTGVTLAVEKRNWGRGGEWGIKIAAVLIVAAYACTVPSDLGEAPAIHAIRLLLLAFAAHLFVSFAPFIADRDINAFWQYNKTLFLRIFISALFAQVVFAGLAFALAALDNLFGMQIPGRRYPQLFILVNGMFTTWFFLTGIPEERESFSASSDYPKGLRVFAQHILLPIVLIYLVILYAYLGKILISWEWPEGWVSKLILGFSGTGILCLMLLHPLSGRTENLWIRTMTRWFYVALIPVIVMLFLAVWRRVSEYGVTEGRYLAVALGVWLAVVVFYFLALPRKNIKFIPASLFLGTILVTFGPWSVFAVAEHSQVSRLEALLQKNAMFAGGKAVKSAGILQASDTREISAILSYLHDIHGYDAIQPWYNEALREDTTKAGVRYKSAEDVAALLGIQYTRARELPGGVTLLTADRDKAFDIRGYDYMMRSQNINAEKTGRTYRCEHFSYRVSASLDTLTVTFTRDGIPLDSARIDIGRFARTVLSDRDSVGSDTIPPESMSVVNSAGSFRVKVCLAEARLQSIDHQIKLLSYKGDILCSMDSSR